MPRRRKQVNPDNENEPLARLPASNDLGGAGVMSETDERRERELEDILQEVGTDGRVRIWHVIDGKPSFAGEMSIDGFTLSELLDNYGGGDKTLAIYQGRRRVETVRVSLDPSIPPTNPREQRLKAQNGNGIGGSSLGDFSTVLTTMMAAQASSMDMFSKMMLMQQSSSQSMISAVTALLTARPEKDPMDTALKMAEVMRPASGGSEAFAAFREGMNMARDMADSMPQDDGTIGVIRDGLGVVGKALEAAQTPRIAVPVDQRQIPAQATPALTTPLSQAGTNMARDMTAATQSKPDDLTAPHAGDRPWIAAVRPLLPQLAVAIKFLSGTSAAHEVVNRASDEVLEDLMDDLDDATPPGFLGRVQKAFPVFQPSPEWAQQFEDALRASLTEVEEGAEEAAT